MSQSWDDDQTMRRWVRSAQVKDGSPYTHSRERVLAAYRRLRREGRTPQQAMGKLWGMLYALELSQEQGALTTDNRMAAEIAWDCAHANRYLRMIQHRQGRRTYWFLGR